MRFGQSLDSLSNPESYDALGTVPTTGTGTNCFSNHEILLPAHRLSYLNLVQGVTKTYLKYFLHIEKDLLKP